MIGRNVGWLLGDEGNRGRGRAEVGTSAADPDGTARALALYQHLGYVPMQEEPHLEHWSFTFSDGELHEGEEWLIDLRKEL